MKSITDFVRRYRMFFCVAVCALLPYLLYGFRYFPVLDDYIQFWAYPSYGSLSYVYLTIGTLATRPLAHLLDPIFWGNFWPFMGLALLLVTLMHLFSAVFFHKTLIKYHASLSPLFFIIYLLFPLGMEGRYWLSASTRIITGLFFANMSLLFSAKFLQEKQSAKYFVPFAVFQLLSCGFYESVAIFSVSAACILFLISFYQNRKKSIFLVPITSLLNIGAMFFYYRIFADLGLQGSRAASVSLLALPVKTVEVLLQLKEVFFLLFDTLIRGAWWGVRLLIKNGAWGIFIFLLILAVCLLLCRFVTKVREKNTAKSLCFILFGLILFFAPLLSNAMAETVWITNRSMLISIIGLALMIEPFFSYIPKRRIRQAVLFVITFLCLTATVNEYDVYRRNSELDAKLLGQIIIQMEDAVACGEKDLCIILPEEVRVRQNAFYKDHVKSVFDSDWALTGGLRARAKNLKIHYALPILPGQEIPDQNFQIIELTNVTE